MRGRAPRQKATVLIKKILNSISSEPKSISQIAEECNTNWDTTRKYLESIKDTGLVEEVSDGNKRLFTTIQCKYNKRDGTYFGLPLDPEKERVIDSVYSMIQKEWKKKTGEKPKKTHVHKVMFKANKECSLDLPIGLYQYGGICVKVYEPDTEYEYSDFEGSEKVGKAVKIIVSEYSKEKTPIDLKMRQYLEENNQYYLKKEELSRLIIDSLKTGNFNSDFNKLFNILVAKAPQSKDILYNEILNEYPTLLEDILTVMDKGLVSAYYMEIIDSFNGFWKLITLHIFRDCMSNFYDRGIVNQHMSNDIFQHELELIDLCSELQSLLPKEEEPDDPFYKQLKEAAKKVRVFSAEESKKQGELLEKKRKELGKDKYQDWLFEQVGL